MQGALSVVCVCLILGGVKTGAAQVLSAPLYLANYASSYNAHVVNHDVRYPVAAAPFLAPTVAFQNPLVTNQLIASPLAPSAPVFPQAPLVASRLAPVPSAPVATPLAPQLPVAPPATVEVAARFAAQKKAAAPNPPAPEQLSRSTQAKNEPAPPQVNSVPNSVLAASQFLARQFSQQQVENSAEAPQDKPRFLVAGNSPPVGAQSGEKLNGDDSESVEVNSAESVETPAAPSAPKRPPSPAEAPRARIVFSPVSVLRSPGAPSPYTRLISF